MAVGINYPGILQPVQALGTSHLGPHPSVALVRFLPQATAPNVNGDLTFFNNDDLQTWHDCHLDFASLEITRNGHIQSARIMDRRFWWKFTEITGLWNQRYPDGSIVDGTEKSLWELVDLLLTAMGEAAYGYDFSVLPNDFSDRPLANWKCSNPADELERLCAERGCSISLNHLLNRVVIVQLGAGADVPSSDVQSVEHGFDAGEFPALVKFVVDVEIQAKFAVEWVTVDTDGSIKTLDDATLSYKPSLGWDNEDPTVLIPNATDEQRALAEQYAFRLARVVEFADGTLNVPGLGGAVDDISQCFPLKDRLTETYVNPVTGQVAYLPSKVEGVYMITDAGVEPLANTPAGTPYGGGYQFAGDRGLIHFNAPVFKREGGALVPADLFVTCSFNLQDNETKQYLYYSVTRSLSGGRGTFPIVREDLKYTIVADYSPPAVVSGTTTNQTDIEAIAESAIDAILPQFSAYPISQIRYCGIKPIDVDGVNRQVTLTASRAKGANTRVARNSEPEFGVIRPRERALISQQRQRIQKNSEMTEQITEYKRKRLGGLE